MANGAQYTVYIPDTSAAKFFPTTFTPEEVRQALVGSGYTAVQTAELVVAGNTLTFRRPQGGQKGL